MSNSEVGPKLGRLPDLPNRTRILDTKEIFNNVAFAAVGNSVVAATAGFGMGAAALADVDMHNAVAEAVKRAVVGAPLVFDTGMTEAHVVEKLVFEVLEEHRSADLFHEVDVLVSVDIIARGQG